MTPNVRVARAAGRKIQDAKMAANGRVSEIREILHEATKKRQRLDDAELQQMLALDIATFNEIAAILDTIEAVSE